MSPKPHIPSDAEIEVVDRVWSGLSGLDETISGSVPAKVQESLKYLSGVGAVLDSIRNEQPKRLEPYAESLVALLRTNAGLDESVAYDVISALFSSVEVARLLADVSAGNLDTVAAVRKNKSDDDTKKPAKKTAAKKAEKPAADPVAEKPADPAAAVIEEPEPVVEPTADPVDVPCDESIDPNDFDLPVVETPDPPKKKAAAKRPAAVPVASSIGAGLVDDGDDDF